jgi:hypothetical protein
MRLAIATALAVLVAAPAAAQNHQTTFRDSRGSTIGTATTNSNGTTTFRNGSGQTTGTAMRDSYGTTTFRNNLGQQTGTATGPRR